MKENYSWSDEQLKVSSKLLLMFSAPFTIWLSGMIYFLQRDLFLFGKRISAVNNTNLLCVIASAFLLSFVFIAAFPKMTVWAERIMLPLGFSATLLLLFPFSDTVVVTLLYVSVFVCFFSCCAGISAACHMFTVETNWKGSAIGISIGGLFIAFLKNNVFKIGFDVFTILSLFLIMILTAFFYNIPAKIRVPMAKNRDRVKLPEITFIGIMVIIGLSALLSGFTLYFATRASHGLSFSFGAAAIFALISFMMWRVMKGTSIKLFSICFILMLAGVITAYISLSSSKLYLTACVFLGFSIVISHMCVFLMSTAFSMYPTRLIAVIGITVILTVHIISAWLTNTLSNNVPLLFGIFGAVAFVLMAVYFVLAKYFVYAFNSHTLGTNIKLVGQPFSLPHKVQTSREPHIFDALTDHELMVVKLLLEGHTNRSIAKNMCIDFASEKQYKSHIYSVLNIRFKSSLFRIVAKHPYEF